MGAQVGVLSLSQLQLHDHYNENSGGVINRIGRVASATVKMTGGGQRTTTAGAWVLLKRFIVLEDTPGTMDINVELTRAGAAGTVHCEARLYRGTTGALLWTGVDNSEVAGPTVFTDAAVAIDLLAGDRIEIWGYKIGAGTICSVDDLECCYTGYITHFSRRAVNAAILLTAASDILYTVVY